MEITYHKEGDYMIPDITIEPQNKLNIGKYGRMRLNYIKEHKRGLWTELLMTGELNNHLIEIDKQVTEKVNQLVMELAKKNKIDEKMKQENQLLWVQNMNNLKNQAEEIVYQELIYN